MAFAAAKPTEVLNFVAGPKTCPTTHEEFILEADASTKLIPNGGAVADVTRGQGTLVLAALILSGVLATKFGKARGCSFFDRSKSVTEDAVPLAHAAA